MASIPLCESLTKGIGLRAHWAKQPSIFLPGLAVGTSGELFQGFAAANGDVAPLGGDEALTFEHVERSGNTGSPHGQHQRQESWVSAISSLSERSWHISGQRASRTSIWWTALESAVNPVCILSVCTSHRSWS